MNPWISAMRLRTLPLSIAGIITGGTMAYKDHQQVFDPLIFLLAIVTALLLQVLSNFANDYGDFVKGTDNENRLGPSRTLQAGSISTQEMKRAIFLLIAVTLASGITLLFVAFRGIDPEFILFFIAGVLAIAAAIKYTMGQNPYGYRGLGDVFVFLFFGLVSGCGTYFLLSHTFNPNVLLPSVSIGAWSTAVLNLNNLRDIENDTASGKITIPVRIGKSKGLIYHYLLILVPFICNILYSVLTANMILLGCTLFCLLLAVLVFHPLFRDPDHETLDLSLKKTALFTLLFTFAFVSGLVFG
jgi:1,4-dihydroxy-2-naphthoate octaprenyltransferase